jgi:exosortase/archaeosortase family protein
MGHMQARNNPMVITRQITGRNALFLLFLVLSTVLFYDPMKLLVISSLDNELYSHIILIPFVTIYLIYTGREEIFQGSGASVVPGSILIVAGVVFYLVGRGFGTDLDQNDFLSVMTFAAVLCWIGGFIFFYGRESSRLALFPLLFLLFMVPVPGFLMERVILLLQICSALFIVSILAGHLFLTSRKRKFILSLCVLPITIVKNAIRIVTLTLLGVYVDPRILDSMVHRRGGIPFFIVALSLLGVVLWLLRRSESNGFFQEQL